MRSLVMFFAFIALILLLNLFMRRASADQVAHSGQIIENSGDPADCIICHDGVIAPEARYCTVDCGFATPHSILKEYPPRFKESSYASLESLQEKGIRLFNGKITCISCHDLKKTTKYHLIMENSGSALCYSCHVT